MNLSEIRTNLQDFYGNPVAAQDTFYNRIVNVAYKKICAMADWWWLEDQWVLTANGPVATFTGSATEGSDSITSVSPSASLYVERAWLKAEERTYEIIGNTGGTALQLDSNWLDDTAASASFSCWKDAYIMPTAVKFVKQVTCRGDPNHRPLRQVLPQDIEAWGPDLTDVESEFADRFAVFATPDPTATAHAFYLRLFPPPEESTEYLVRYQVAIGELSGDTDIPRMPEEHHPLLADMAKLELCINEGEDPDRVATFERLVGIGMQRMIRDQSRRGNVQHRFGRRGAVVSAKPTQYALKNVEGLIW